MQQGIGKKVLSVLAGAGTTSLLFYFLWDIYYVWWFIGVMVCLEILSVTSHKQGALYGALVMDTHVVFLDLWWSIEAMHAYVDPGPLGPFWIIYALIVSSIVGATFGLIGVTLRNAIQKWRRGRE